MGSLRKQNFVRNKNKERNVIYTYIYIFMNILLLCYVIFILPLYGWNCVLKKSTGIVWK